MDVFCLEMDKYFTWLKVTAKLCKIGVGIVGTVCARRGWLAKELSNVTQQDANFNNFFWTVNDFGTFCCVVDGYWACPLCGYSSQGSRNSDYVKKMPKNCMS
eukprot:11841517-Ditylum_brightwellii.AAC.1